MASLDDQSPNETSENESIASEQGAMLEINPITNEVASNNSSSTNVTSTNNGLELISLPAELRVLIFHHLLVQDRPLSPYLSRAAYQTVAIFSTCKRIREEAFHVFYSENTFRIFTDPRFSILNNQLISDTIRNVHIDVRLIDPLLDQRRQHFFRVIRDFVTPAIVRGTLTLLFHIGPSRVTLPPWFVRILPRYTVFRNIRVEYLYDFLIPGKPFPIFSRIFARRICQIHQSTYTPVFGPATSVAEGRGRLFRPQAYLNSLPREVDVDWMDHLDGIRLDWNQDSLTNADEPEA